MNALTIENILNAGTFLHPDSSLHPTTVAYIQQLLNPYAEAIEPAAIDDVVQWIPLAFPGRLANDLLEEFNGAKYRKQSELAGVDGQHEMYADDPNVATEAKTAIIQYIVSEIIQLAGDVSRVRGDLNILPWEVQTAVADNEELAKMLGVAPGDKQLPVTVTVGPQQFTHMLSEEFALGLLLFSTPNIGNTDFDMVMFGAKLAPDYMAPAADGAHRPRFLNDEDDWSEYEVSVGEKKVHFNTPDFMQGFSTGALWIGVDHHNYWTNLIRREDDGTNTPLQF